MSLAGSETPHQRLDVWLCYARLAKTRTLGQTLVQRGKVRVNRIRVDKPSHNLKPGDVVTLSLGPTVRVVEVLGIGKRRGPAPEAAALFRELTPAPDRTTSSRPETQSGGKDHPALQASVAANGMRLPGTGRPSKRDRRATERLKDRFGDG